MPSCPDSDTLTEQLLLGAASLPTLADIPLRVLALLDGEDVSLDAVAEEIEGDPVLAARLLRLANSPLFGNVQSVDTVTKAVVRLGAGEVRTVVLTLAFIDSLGKDSRIFDMREVFREAVCCASLSRQLARDLRAADPATAYLAGLLHSMGEIVLGLCFSERFERAILHARRHLTSAQDALESEFGVPAARLGARLLERWRMPPRVVDAVRFQNEPEASPMADSLAEVVGAARRTARSFGIGIEWPGDSTRDWISEAEPILHRAHGPTGDSALYVQARRAQLTDLDETLSVLLPEAGCRTALLS